MLQNKSQVVDAIKTVAMALGEMNQQIVFVGGAIAGMYVDDPGAPEMRPTKDIDIVFEITSLLELEDLRRRLAERGFQFAKDEKVMCRFIYKDILIDVMSTKNVGWAPANPWFKSGFDFAETIFLDEIKIKIMPFCYYLASKFVAFKERGTEARTSHDFEDIVYLLDNRLTLTKDILGSQEDVKIFLINEFSAMLNEESLQEAVLAHLEPEFQTQRYKMLIQKLKEIIV